MRHAYQYTLDGNGGTTQMAIVRVIPLVSSSENLSDGLIQDPVVHVAGTYAVLTWFTYKLAAISTQRRLN